MTSLIWKGYHATLESHHLRDLANGLKSADLASSFRQSTPSTIPLLVRLLRHFKEEILLQGLWAAIASVTVYVPVHLLYGILRYLEVPDATPSSRAWLLVAGLLVSGLVSSLAHAQCEWTGQKTAAKLKSTLIGELYAKTLRSTQQIKSGSTVVDLVSVDAIVISEASAHLHLFWASVPGQLLVASWTLYSIMGASGVVGVCSLVALLPLRFYMSKRRTVALHQASGAADSRGKMTTELLAGVELIKYYEWESCFHGRVSRSRRAELAKLRSGFAWWSAHTTACCSAPIIAALVTFFFYTVVAGLPLQNSGAFPALAAFAFLRVPLERASDMVLVTLQANASLGKIDRFLGQGQRDTNVAISHTRDAGYTENDPLVGLEPPPLFRLSNLQIAFRPGGLNVVCGPRGSGKSSLLLALLGEMDLVSGRVHSPAETSIAYCPSNPWIQNKTIREQVTFGLPFDYLRYKTALEAVALLSELPTLLRGDLTLAGEKGSRLSDSQRRRVAIARALYSRAQCVLLDDCLTGLEAATARHVLVHAIKGPLMRGRTCVLAAQQFRMLMPYCDYAVCLADGKVRYQGSPARLVAARVLPSDVLIDATGLNTDTGNETRGATQSRKFGNRSSDQFVFKNFSRAPTRREKESEANQDREDESTVAFSWPAIKLYLCSMGRGPYWLLTLCAFVAQPLMRLGLNLWIAQWARQTNESVGPSRGKGTYYVGIYGSMTIVIALMSLMRDAIAFHGAHKASERIHDRLLSAILGAKFSFLDRTPVGHIASLFSNDAQVVDRDLALSCVGALQLVANMVVVTTFISFVLPVFPLVAAPIGLAYSAVGAFYIRLTRRLNRIAATKRSSVCQHIQETLAGSVTVRAYGQVSTFAIQGHDLTDQESRPTVHHAAAREWLVCRVACLSAVTSSMAAALILWGREGYGVSAGAAGLVLTFSMTYTDNVLGFIRFCSQSQRGLGSLERIRECTNAEREPVESIKELRVPTYTWPQRGSIRFRNYSTRYGSTQGLVLRNLDVRIGGGQRVAIVGHKGAGKSTMAMAMIHRLEAAGGLVELDGVDIASLKLSQLRQLLTVVPKDPCPALFSGSVRECLDPQLRHTDERIYEVMQSLRLSRIIPVGLDEVVPALTPSQRQLLCIARAILRESIVIVLDQATDGVDAEAEDFVQAALREINVAGTTVVTIAHRLVSIADYDSVVALSAGTVAEEGPPERLLDKDETRDPSALFRNMCVHSGELQLIERTAGLRT
ncbi:ABC transporter [Hirsutella rhossiliensis]|uniref:ABC transporter domain-containing protein n=1 Tax=Hirsutella rhossiliensis TaxID=111463 RepID=A0A9P8MVM7_9HYPO|nr:ABC transporter domain-containing protein [Hirsutella rhossiliensis]KAH0961867.1 ABC transporter domain-containing protein [Hirsutella rhossiliensis]